VNGQVVWRDTNGFTRVAALHPWFFANRPPPEATNGLVGWQTYYRSFTNFLDPALGARYWAKRHQAMRGAFTNLLNVTLTNSPAEDVLRVLERFEPDLAELKREADQRPLDRWRLDYKADSDWSILLPHLANLRGICSLLQLREMARLASGDTAGALSDFHLGVRLANSVRVEPFLISHLVGWVCWDLLLEPLKQGLRRHQVAEGQIRDIERELLSADLLADYHSAACAERGFKGTSWIKFDRRMYRQMASFMDERFTGPLRALAWFNTLAPRGWIYQNQLTLCRAYDDFAVSAVDLTTRTVPPQHTRDSDRLALFQIRGPYSVVAAIEFHWQALLGSPYARCDSVAYAQTQIDEALVACALERCRQVHGEYPETLDALAPQYLARMPHDLINGQPLHYHLTPSGSYVLYSVGWNETDDGGLVVWNSDGQVDITKGDWAW